MKKILALVLALVMCFVIVACDDKKDEGTTTAVPGTTAAADSKPADTTAEAPADTTAEAPADTTAADTEKVEVSLATEGKYNLAGMGSEDGLIDVSGLGISIVIELKKGGEATYDDGEDKMEGTWEQDGKNITITFEDDPASGTIENGVISVGDDEMYMVFVKEGVTADLDFAELPDDGGLTTDSETLVGEYKLVAIGVNLEYYKAEDLGVAMTLKLEKDGKGSMSVSDGTQSDEGEITWEFDGVFTITVTDDEGEALEGIYMDGVISFDADDTTEMVFAAEGADVDLDFSEVPTEE